MDFIYEILNISLYSVLGILLMIAGNILIDLAVPCHFPTEIKKGNEAVGWLCCGSFIGIGTILRAAIMTPSVSAAAESLAEGILSSVFYFILGILFFLLGYYAVHKMNRKYNLNEEIAKGNKAAGILVCGIFVGLGILISGVIV